MKRRAPTQSPESETGMAIRRRPLYPDFQVIVMSMGLLIAYHMTKNTVAAAKHSQLDNNKEDEPIGYHRLQEVLSSIEDRLRDPFGYSLARVDFSLEQLGRRLENIEAKLSSFEAKIDQADRNNNGQMSPSCQQWSSQTTYFEAKVDVQLSRISARLDVLERELLTGRTPQRGAEDEYRMGCRGCTSIRDTLSIRDMMVNIVSSNLERVEEAIKVYTMETASGVWERIDRSLSDVEESLLSQINDSLNTLTSKCGDRTDPSDSSSGHEKVEMLSLAVQKAITQSETKFRKLDSDVEQYTRKVIGSIRDMWASSDRVKNSLDEALRLGNRTRETVRYEFSKLHQQLEPLPRLEPRLSDVSSVLNQKLGELGATVDRSFATLLIAQNTFIDNCRRLHDEETQAYDVLQAIVHEMRNRSVTDMGRIAADIRAHGDRIGRSFEAVLNAVFSVGNTTADRIGKLLPRQCTHSVTTSETETTEEAPLAPSTVGNSQKSPDYDQDYHVPENDHVTENDYVDI